MFTRFKTRQYATLVIIIAVFSSLFSCCKTHGQEANDASRDDRVLLDSSAWEHWKTEEGFSLDKRLERRISIWEERLSIADILARLGEESQVSLKALEPELQTQELTVFVKDLPLKSFMHQLSELLGVFWYRREGEEGELEYLVTYGSELAPLRGAQEIEERELFERRRRALRIADYLEAYSMTEEELMSRVEEDPMLVGTMLKNPVARYSIEILAEMPPDKLRQLINEGHVFLTVHELPAWAEENLRENYGESKYMPRHISVERFLERFRLLFGDGGQLTPKDGIFYDMTGGDWRGLRHGCIRLREADEKPSGGFENAPDWMPDTACHIHGAPYLPPEMAYAMSYIRHNRLPGKGSERNIRAEYPELLGLEGSQGHYFYKNIRERMEEKESRMADSPWKDDEKLSRIPEFETSDLRHDDEVASLLLAVAKQTGYCVIGTYYEKKAPVCTGSAKESDPLFVLLNRIAESYDCTWQLTRPVITWRHNDWFVYEAQRASDETESLPESVSSED